MLSVMSVDTTWLLITSAQVMLLVLLAQTGLGSPSLPWLGRRSPAISGAVVAVAAPDGFGSAAADTVDAEFEELPAGEEPSASPEEPLPLYTGGAAAQSPAPATWWSRLPIPGQVRPALPFVLVGVVSVVASALFLPGKGGGAAAADLEALTARVVSAEEHLATATADLRTLDERLIAALAVVDGLVEQAADPDAAVASGEDHDAGASGSVPGAVDGTVYSLFGGEATPVSAAVADPPAELPVTDERPAATDGRNLWDCADFATWDAANEVYLANVPGDPNRLDIDGNGVPCESLRAPS